MATMLSLYTLLLIDIHLQTKISKLYKIKNFFLNLKLQQ